MLKTSKIIARSGIVAALYTALSLLAFPIASGAIQVRLGEAFTLLPLLFPESIMGLFVGCIAVNFITGTALLEAILGSVITLLAGILTCLIGKVVKKTFWKIILGGLFPVLLNALLLPLIWLWCYNTISYGFILSVLFVLIGQTVSVYGVGTFILIGIKKLKLKNVDFFK